MKKQLFPKEIIDRSVEQHFVHHYTKTLVIYGDILKLKRNKQHTLRIFNKTKARIPTSAEKNISTIVMQKMLDKLNINDGFDVFFLQKIKPSGGLGSSSASAVAAVFGLNYLLGNIYSKKKTHLLCHSRGGNY